MCRTSGRLGNSVTINAGVRYDLQLLETITTDRNNVSPRVGVAWTPSESAPHHRARQRRPLLRSRPAARARQRAVVGRQHHRRRRALRQFVVSLSPTQSGRAGVSGDPPGGGAERDAAQPDDDGPRPAECVFAPGERRGRTSDRRPRDGQRRLPVPQGIAPADVGQPERPDLRGVRHQQRLPAQCRRTRTTANTRRSATRTITACTSRCRSGRDAWGHYRVSYTLVEVDEQRRRILLQLADRSDGSFEGLGTLRQRSAASAGDQRLARRFAAFSSAAWCRPIRRRRSTSPPGVTTVQGTAGRPIVDGEFIERNAGEGTRSSRSARASADRSASRAAGSSKCSPKASISPNRANVVTRNTNFGPGAYPANPVRRPSTRSPPSANRARSSSAPG